MLNYLTRKISNNKTQIGEHSLATSAAVVSRLSMLFITLINTQFLPPSEFGIFAVLILIANMVNAFVSCGGDMWLNRFTRRRHANFVRAPIVARFYLQIAVSLAGMVVFVALGFATFGQRAFEDHGLAIAFSLLWAASAGMIETILAILRTTNDIHRFFIIRDLLMPIALILAIIILKINTCLEFFLTAFLLWLGTLIFLLNFILSRAHLYMPQSYWNWKFLRKGLISYTAGLIINNFSARLVNGFDTLILTRFLPIALVGKYRFVAHFSNAFTVIQHFVFLALPWHLRQGKGCAHDLQRLRTVRIRQVFLMASAFPALLIFILLAKPLLGFLGTEFRAMAPLLIIFLLIRFSELLWGPQHETLISNNKVVEDTIANAVGIITGGTLFAVCMHYYNVIVGAVVASSFSSIIVQSVRYVFLKDRKQSLKKAIWKDVPWLSIMITLLSIGYIIENELIGSY